MALKLILLIISLSLLSKSSQENIDYVKDTLKINLMTNYNSNNLPLKNPSGVLVISLNLLVTHANILEKQSLLETYGNLEIVRFKNCSHSISISRESCSTLSVECITYPNNSQLISDKLENS
jgi:hypothetical protein